LDGFGISCCYRKRNILLRKIQMRKKGTQERKAFAC
jgi:hypothetical protein